MGSPDWATKPEYGNKIQRTANWGELRPLVWEWVSRQDVLDLCLRAQASRVPFAPLSTMRTLLESAHLDERQFFVELDHPVAGRLKYAGALAKFPASPWRAHVAAPTLGQHNGRVYAELLKMSPTEIAELSRAGVI